MKLITVFLPKFADYPYDTEYRAYKLLSKNPLPYDVNYLVVPWAVLIRDNLLEKFPKIRLNGGFTICQHLAYEIIIPLLRKIGVNVLFATSANKKKKYSGVTVLPFPFYPINGKLPAKGKNILYSFIGANGHIPIRKKILKLPRYRNTVIKERGSWNFYLPDSMRYYNEKEYSNVLSHSRYSLCPRGVGPGSIRFWESLASGAIPVLFDDDMWLPDGFDWSKCVVSCGQDKLYELYFMLRSIPYKQELEMRENCLKAHKQFSGNNLISVIFDYYKNIYEVNK